MPQLNIHQIRKILPHRYPFLLVDRVTEFEPDKRIVGIKDASGDISRVTDHRMGIGKQFCQLSGDDRRGRNNECSGGR